MRKTECAIFISHKLPGSPYDNEPLDSPDAFRRLSERSDETDKARIIVFSITEAQARRIVDRLWPGETLMGATCGRGFSIETAEQTAVVNEILGPDIHIFCDPEKLQCDIQTW